MNDCFHPCAVAGCGTGIVQSKMFCAAHWRAIPSPVLLAGKRLYREARRARIPDKQARELVSKWQAAFFAADQQLPWWERKMPPFPTLAAK